MTFTAFKTCAKTTNCGDHSTRVSALTQKFEQARIMTKSTSPSPSPSPSP